MDISIKAVVTNADGSKFYTETHEWNGVSGEGADFILKGLTDSAAKANSLHNQHKKADNANLNVVLSATVDGKAQPDVRLTGVSYRAMHEHQKYWNDLGGDLIKLGAKKADQKKGK